MNQLRAFLQSHVWGLVISLAVGAIIAAPPVLFRLSKDYAGLPMMKTNTEAHYVSQIQEVWDGHDWLGNPFFADLKEEPYLFPPLGPHIYAGLGWVLGLSTISSVLLLRFVFTSAMAFFIYLFASAASGNKMAGYISAPFVMLGYSLVDPGHVLTVIRSGIPEHAGFLDYGRPVNPQLSSLFFFSYLYFFWRTLHETTKTWRVFAGVSAIILGFSFYVYLFTWTFIFSLNGFLFLLSLIKKEKESMRRIAAVSLGAAVLGIPYLLHTLEVSRHPWYADSAPRFGFVHMRQWQISRLIVGMFALFLLASRRLSADARQFFLAFFLTALFVVNEQVLTGLYVFNHHYHWYYSTPLAIVALVVIATAWLPSFVREEQKRQLVLFVWIGTLFVYGIANQHVAYARALPAVKEEQRYAPLVEWLHTQPKDRTVFADYDLTNFLPAITHQNVNYHGTSMYTLVPSERLLHQYLLYTYLDAVPTSSARAYFEAHRNEISAFVYAYTYSFVPGVCYGCFPDSVIDGMVAKYEQFNDSNFAGEIRKYPVDYIVWDRQKKPEWAPERFGFPFLVRFGDLFVYTSATSSPL
jgi:hypothetical protein